MIFGCSLTLKSQPKIQEKLLKHSVIITFKSNTPLTVINAVDQSFTNLSKLPMVKGFEWGVISEDEKNQVKHIYITNFASKQGEDEYGKSKEHQAHIKLGAEYVESVQVIDYLAFQ